MVFFSEFESHELQLPELAVAADVVLNCAQPMTSKSENTIALCTKADNSWKCPVFLIESH